MDHVGLRSSTVASEHELGAAGWHQSVEVSSVAEVSCGHGRREHVRHSLVYIPSGRRGVRRMCMLSSGTERGSRQAVRALHR